MSGGVAFVAGDVHQGRYGNQVNIASGAQIPAGIYYIDVNWTLTTPDGVTHVQPTGYVNSDGFSCTANTAGHLIPVGAKA